MKRLLLLLPIIFLLAFMYLFNLRPAPDALSTYLVDPGENIADSDLTVQFLGNTNLLFTDGETSILTDGFFSRPPAHKVLFGKVSPKRHVITDCLDKAGIDRLDAVIPLHSHFDHAMDAPLVADLTGANLIGSRSTLNIGHGYGLPDVRMREAPLNEPIAIGKFNITFISSRHWQYPDEKQRERLLDQAIDAPLVPPASIYDYKEGITYTLLIDYDSLKIAIQGTAGFREGSVEHYDADILFLAIAGIEVMDEAYNSGYQEHIIEALQPEALVPVHWDDFTTPLSKGLKTTNVLFNMKFGSNLGKAFEIIESNNIQAGRNIKVLPLWEKVSVKDLIDN